MDEREELKRLRQPVRSLRLEKEILNKASQYFAKDNAAKYGFIGRHAGRYRVTMRCRVLGVQRSAYYAWRGQPGTVIAPQELALRGRMTALFAASRGSLGSRMLMHNLNQEGFQMGRERRRGLMQTLHLKVRHKRKYKVTTDSKHRLPVAQHGLNRAFSPLAPNQAWGADITYLWTQPG